MRFVGEQRYKFSILTNPNLLSYFRLQTPLPEELEERFIAKGKALGLVDENNTFDLSEFHQLITSLFISSNKVLQLFGNTFDISNLKPTKIIYNNQECFYRYDFYKYSNGSQHDDLKDELFLKLLKHYSDTTLKIVNQQIDFNCRTFPAFRLVILNKIRYNPKRLLIDSVKNQVIYKFNDNTQVIFSLNKSLEFVNRQKALKFSNDTDGHLSIDEDAFFEDGSLPEDNKQSKKASSDLFGDLATEAVEKTVNNESKTAETTSETGTILDNLAGSNTTSESSNTSEKSMANVSSSTNTSNGRVDNEHAFESESSKESKKLSTPGPLANDGAVKNLITSTYTPNSIQSDNTSATDGNIGSQESSTSSSESTSEQATSVSETKSLVDTSTSESNVTSVANVRSSEEQEAKVNNMFGSSNDEVPSQSYRAVPNITGLELSKELEANPFIDSSRPIEGITFMGSKIYELSPVLNTLDVSVKDSNDVFLYIFNTIIKSLELKNDSAIPTDSALHEFEIQVKILLLLRKKDYMLFFLLSKENLTIDQWRITWFSYLYVNLASIDTKLRDILENRQNATKDSEVYDFSSSDIRNYLFQSINSNEFFSNTKTPITIPAGLDFRKPLPGVNLPSINANFKKTSNGALPYLFIAFYYEPNTCNSNTNEFKRVNPITQPVVSKPIGLDVNSNAFLNNIKDIVASEFHTFLGDFRNNLNPLLDVDLINRQLLTYILANKFDLGNDVHLEDILQSNQVTKRINELNKLSSTLHKKHIEVLKTNARKH